MDDYCSPNDIVASTVNWDEAQSACGDKLPRPDNLAYYAYVLNL